MSFVKLQNNRDKKNILKVSKVKGKWFRYLYKRPLNFSIAAPEVRRAMSNTFKILRKKTAYNMKI